MRFYPLRNLANHLITFSDVGIEVEYHQKISGSYDPLTGSATEQILVQLVKAYPHVPSQEEIPNDVQGQVIAFLISPSVISGEMSIGDNVVWNGRVWEAFRVVRYEAGVTALFEVYCQLAGVKV